MTTNDIRELIVKAYEKTHNETEIAKYFSVDVSTVSRIVKRYKETGSSELYTSKCGRNRLLSDEDKKHIDELIQKKPDITVSEIHETLQLTVCDGTIRNAISELGYRYKRKSLHAWERDRPRCAEET